MKAFVVVLAIAFWAAVAFYVHFKEQIDDYAGKHPKDPAEAMRIVAADFPEEDGIHGMRFNVTKTDSLLNPIVGNIDFYRGIEYRCIFHWKDSRWQFVRLLCLDNGMDHTYTEGGIELMNGQNETISDQVRFHTAAEPRGGSGANRRGGTDTDSKAVGERARSWFDVRRGHPISDPSLRTAYDARARPGECRDRAEIRFAQMTLSEVRAKLCQDPMFMRFYTRYRRMPRRAFLGLLKRETKRLARK